MGFDIKNLIANVEKLVNQGTGRTNDGELQAEEKKRIPSVFEAQKLIKDAMNAEDGLSKEDVNTIFGLQLSSTGELEYVEKAGQSMTRGVNISITINIDINVVVNACNGCGSDKDAALEKLVAILLDAITQPGGKVEDFILALIGKFGSTNQVDFSSLETLLKEISEKLDKQGKHIEELDNSIKNLSKYLKTEFETLFKTLSSFGVNLTNIYNLVKQCDENDTQILTKLGQIYDAIMDITGTINNYTAKFDNFTEIEQKRYNTVVELIGNLNVGSPDEIMQKLELMHTLLLSISADTSETKTNSETIINLVKEGNTKVLEAIANINIEGYDDTEIKKMLTSILTNMVTKGDLDVQLEKFNEIVAQFKNSIQASINSGKTEILDAIANISKQIENINIDGYDDTKLRAWLTEMFANIATKGDLNVQTNKFSQMLAKLQNEINVAIKEGNTEVLNAIAEISTKIDNIHIDGYDDTKLRAWLSEMFANVVSKGDFNAQMSKFNQLITSLQAKVEEGDTKILEEIAKISAQIENINLEGYDDTKLRAWLSEMFANLATKGDLETQTNLFSQMLANLQAKVEAGDTAILKAIAEISTKVDNISIDGYDDSKLRAWLTEMFAKLATKGDIEEQTNKFNQIITTLQNSVEGGHAAILKAINDLAVLVAEGDTEILEAIANLSKQIENIHVDGYDDSKLRAWLTEMFANIATKDDLKEQLNKFQEFITCAKNGIECAIKCSEENIINHIKQIAVNPDGPNYDAVVNMFNAIMQKLDGMSADNIKNFGDVLAAIANIKTGEPVDLSQVLELLRKIDSTTTSNGAKLDGVLTNQETIKLMLDGIIDGLKKLDGKVDDIKDVVDEIYDIVKNLHNCDCECINEATLRIILCEFVEQINNDNGPTHEGIIDILGARATTRGVTKSYADYARELREVLFPSNDATGVTSVRTERHDDVVYDLSGKRVEGPLTTGFYIKNGVKFYVK